MKENSEGGDRQRYILKRKGKREELSEGQSVPDGYRYQSVASLSSPCALFATLPSLFLYDIKFLYIYTTTAG